MKTQKRLMQEQKGQGLMEYVIILAFVAVGTMLAIQYFGDSVRVAYGKVATALQGKTYDGTKYEDLGDIHDITKSRDLKNFDER